MSCLVRSDATKQLQSSLCTTQISLSRSFGAAGFLLSSVALQFSGLDELINVPFDSSNSVQTCLWTVVDCLLTRTQSDCLSGQQLTVRHPGGSLISTC